MMKVNNIYVAKGVAERDELAYGIGVTDGCYYVGTTEELEKIPVVIKASYEEPAQV